MCRPRHHFLLGLSLIVIWAWERQQGGEEGVAGICPSPSKVLPPPTLALIQDYRIQMLFPNALLNELEFLRKYEGMKQADRKFFPNNDKKKFSCYTEKLNI